jgi:hypothetical protein
MICPVIQGSFRAAGEEIFLTAEISGAWSSGSVCVRQRFQKCRALLLQTFFESLGAVAIRARPRFGAVLVPAIFAVVRVLDAQQFKKFFPVRPFLRQWCVAKAGLDPVCDAIRADPRVLQIVNVFIAGNRALAERAIGDGLPQIFFASLFHAGFNEITHGLKIHANVTTVEERMPREEDGRAL